MPVVTLAYCRASTNKQELEIQLEMLGRAGYDELYQEHISGTRSDRPEFGRLVTRALELSAVGIEVHVLVVNDSRWARDVVTSLQSIQQLEAAGCKIRGIESGAISLLTPEDFLITTIKAAAAQHYSLNLSREVKKNYASKRSKGKPICNRVSWPYRHGPGGDLEPNPAAWPIARELMERLLAGEACNTALVWLRNTHGIEKSRSWIKKWIHSPVVRGHLEYTEGGLTYAEKMAKAKKPKVMVYNTHPALISEAEYQQLAAAAALRRQLWGKNKGCHIYAVPSVVWCACGRKAGPILDPCNVRRWKCRDLHCPHYTPSTKEAVIEAAIQEAILEAAEAIAADLLAPGTTDPRIATLEAEAAGLRPFAGRAGIAAEIEAIEREVAQLKAAQGNQAAGDAELREAIQAMALVDWEGLSQEERRAIYGALVERVTVEGGEVVGVVIKGV